ncbi:hypothetical protein NEMIN01_2367 [Nematocida minor]|uniref:uncharacterized protein n=1 Tax=Nematocida minor TaxID=1912983 RepID=UPI00221EC782|nr:uncharacterized protein NEMIN01_2367 [Nematocida minor]KAI5193023.1 hypothetical protein NEMIN01_2367 [Nematocida minor]
MFRFEYLHLCKSISMGFVKRYFLKKINQSLAGKTEPIRSDKISFDIIKGIFVIEDVSVNLAFISTLLGIDVKTFKIGEIIFRSNWHSTDLFTEIEVEKVTVELDGNACMCKSSGRCFPCRKRTEDVERVSRSMAFIKYVLGKAFGRLSSRIKLRVKEVDFSVQLESTLAVVLKKLKIAKDEEVYKMSIENKDISIPGVSAGSFKICVDLLSKTKKCRVDMHQIEVDLARIQTAEILELVKTVKYLAGVETKQLEQKHAAGEKEKKDRKTENNYDSAEHETYEDEQSIGAISAGSKNTERASSPLTDVSVDASFKLLGVDGLEDCSFQVKKMKMQVYESEIRGTVSAYLNENKKEVLAVEEADFVIYDKDGNKEAQSSKEIEHTQKVYKLEIKNIVGNIQSEILPGVFRAYERIGCIARDLNGKSSGEEKKRKSKNPSASPDIFITVEQSHIKAGILCAYTYLDVQKTEVQCVKDEVTFSSSMKCMLNNTTLSDEMATSTAEFGISAKYSDKLEVDLLKIAALEESVPNLAIMLYLLANQVQECMLVNRSMLYPSMGTEKTESAANSQKKELPVYIKKCLISGLFGNKPCALSVSDVAVNGGSVVIDRMELMCDKEKLATSTLAHIIVRNNIEISFSNSEVAIPSDDEFVLSIFRDSRTIHMALKEAARKKIATKSIESDKSSKESKNEEAETAEVSNKEPEIGASSDGIIKISLDKASASMKGPGIDLILKVNGLCMEISDSSFQLTSLNAAIHNGSEVLEVVSHELIYRFIDSSLIGNFTGNGFMDVNLHVFSVNRVFFILHCYTILTDLPCIGVPSVPGLSHLENSRSDVQETPKNESEMSIKIDIEASIYLTKQNTILCKLSSNVNLSMLKGLLYHGTVSVMNPKVWSDGLLICHSSEVVVEFRKVSHLLKSFNILIDRVDVQDTIGVFLDIFGQLTKVNYNNNSPSVGTAIDIKCKISTINMKSENTDVILTNFALINSYMQVGFMLKISDKKIFEIPQKITVRTTATEMPEMHIDIETIETTLIGRPEIEGLFSLQNRLGQTRVQKYPIKGNSLLSIKCPSISVKTKHPPVKAELLQLSITAVQLIASPSVNFEGSALCRMFVKVRETKQYEIMTETFPIDITMQSSMPLQKDKAGFCSLPFSDAEDESLLVVFLSFIVKDTIRLRLSKKIIEAFKLSEKSIDLTNLTNKPILVDGNVLDSMCSSHVRDDTFTVHSEDRQAIFDQYVPNTKKAVQVSRNIFLATFKEKSAVIRGATNFKNITDTTIAIHIDKEKIFLPLFSECAHTTILTGFSVNIENDPRSFCNVSFEVPSKATNEPISIIGMRRIEHNDSYITVVCLFEIVSNIPILHYLFHHDFVINNLMLTSLNFEIKISTKSKVEKIVGVAQSCEIKQMSGNIQAEKTKKIRLRINAGVDLVLFPDEMASKVTVSKGVVAVKEPKTVLIGGFPVDVGITQVTIYPILIAINKTHDELYIKSGSTVCEIAHNQQTTLPTSRDRHCLIFYKVESNTFSSKIQYNTMFLDIKSEFQRNYLVNIYQGEGSKEKIKYIVVEYANVIENRTGLDLTIITDREFTCGSGELVPLHFPRKKISTWIKMGSPAIDSELAHTSNSSEISDYILDLEGSPDASYLPLDGLKKHFVKLNTSVENVSIHGMTSSLVKSKSGLLSSTSQAESSDTLSEDDGKEEESEKLQKYINNSILLSVTIQTQNSQRQIIIEKESKWPYLIKNMTQSEMTFSQKGHSLEYILKPGEILPYYWDSFKAQAAFCITVDSVEILVENFAVTTVGEYKATLTSERSRKVLVVSKMTHEVRADTSDIQGTLIRARTGRVSISLLDREEIEFSALHLFNVHLISMLSPNGLEFMLKTDSFQMDNQEIKGYYHIPVHTPIPSDVLSISGWIVNRSMIRYLSIVMLPVVLEIEEVYMKKVIQHFVSLGEPIENPKYFIMCSTCLTSRCKCTYTKPIPDTSAYLSIGYLKIEAVKFKCSFRRASRDSIVPLSSVFCNITSSKVSLPSVELFDIHSRTLGICQIIGRMYKRGLIRNIVSLVLSADIVASPGELFDKLGVGVHDLIYAPYRAMDNPALLSKQLLIGGKSLAKNVVTGLAGFVGNVMGKFSQKLADISMDENFAEAIRETSCIYIDELDLGLPVSKTHLSKAGEKFMGSVISGFKGVVHSPMQGRRSNGISGMMQGIGKGLVGAIFKPISGAVGLMQGLSTSITGVLGSDKPLLRIQLPRAPPLDGVPCEYEVERNAYYRAYTVLARGDAKKEEVFLTGGICTKKYIGWYILITSARVIFYNKEEIQEIPGVSIAQQSEKNTLLSVGSVEIYLEGLRVYRELEKYSALMVLKKDQAES